MQAHPHPHCGPSTAPASDRQPQAGQALDPSLGKSCCPHGVLWSEELVRCVGLRAPPQRCQWGMEVPRLEVKRHCSCWPAPQPQQRRILAPSGAYTTIRPCGILNPLGGARDQTRILTTLCRVLNPLSHNGNALSRHSQGRGSLITETQTRPSLLCSFSAAQIFLHCTCQNSYPNIHQWDSLTPIHLLHPTEGQFPK